MSLLQIETVPGPAHESPQLASNIILPVTHDDWRKRWWIVVIFAIAMAWVESAVVYYLRTMIDRIEPYQPVPLPHFGGLVFAELVREVATLIMLTTVGCLAGRTRQSRLGFALLAFGIWDLFYYVFLRCLAPWPNSLFDWDILFLLPLPWWGPVLAPCLIATLMVSWGTLQARDETDGTRPHSISRLNVVALAIGVGLTLYSFMEEALGHIWRGHRQFSEMLPQSFNWPIFLLGLVCLAIPVTRGYFPRVMPRKATL